ncbi:DUF2956 domain-containing protein [Vibrio algivorus]|uniref:DUF2956 domain-containing protein n=1 Tax=Vibrio algivorus TaxID=1667024 RepID=A0A557PAF1_9VIBR|nr:DUF2956 domain-containing protein [Vibrio algivorus]TVO37620.1 DUF2956 domain-containing protein [Vibrio algivorus]
MKPSKKNISPETQQEALAVAKSTQKPGQTKEQTKLIAQGIEKGIALYKKQHKEKLREADKLRKKQSKNIHQEQTPSNIQLSTSDHKPSKPSVLPWALVILSWVGFAIYLLLQQ